MTPPPKPLPTAYYFSGVCMTRYLYSLLQKKTNKKPVEFEPSKLKHMNLKLFAFSVIVNVK
jgi:hypothetical protein